MNSMFSSRVARSLVVAFGVIVVALLAFFVGRSSKADEVASPSETSPVVTTSPESPGDTEVLDLTSPILESALAFDRQLTTLASFGTEEDLSFVDPRQGVNLIQMLGGMTDPTLQIEDTPDAGVDVNSLTRDSLRVLIWSPDTSSWVRLCSHAGCVVSLDSVGVTAGKIPLGSTPSAATTAPFCLAFHASGQTSYLGASEAANVKGLVSLALEEACGAAVTSQATGSYYLLGNPTPVTDASW